MRSVFVIGPDKKVKLTITYPAAPAATSTRSCASSTRCSSRPATAWRTPVNWKDGDDVIIVPSVSDDDAKGKFPKGWKAIKPYLRLTPQPNK